MPVIKNCSAGGPGRISASGSRIQDIVWPVRSPAAAAIVLTGIASVAVPIPYATPVSGQYCMNVCLVNSLSCALLEILTCTSYPKVSRSICLVG